MPKPRLSIRTFLLFCIFLGAVGIPGGWKLYQLRREAEIKRLEKQLTELWANEPPEFIHSVTSDTFGRTVSSTSGNPLHNDWKQQLKRLEDRLTKLTGNLPSRPPDEMEPIIEVLNGPTPLPSGSTQY